MKALKIVAILLVIYVAIVAIFESLIGYYQPENQSTQVLVTTSPDGVSNPRVVARLESSDQLYVAANHWPRAWYRHALANPEVQVVFGDEMLDYLAVPVEGAEHDQVDADNPLGPVFRFLTGYPPRYFVRLDPR